MKSISEKTKGIIIGIFIALSAVGIISAITVSSAHTNENSESDMMHSMMTNGNGEMDMTGCMSMMHGQLTEEEVEEMLKSMDEDGDGICDMCGMSIEACRDMMLS